MAKKKSNSLPEGFVELSSQLSGFFIVEEGNQLQGILEGFFVNRSSKFGPKKVYKVRLTQDGTRVATKADGEKDATVDDLIGVDEKGYLKKLADVPEGTEIFVRCAGREKESRVKGQQPAWVFQIGTVPFGKGRRREPGDDDDIPIQ